MSITEPTLWQSRWQAIDNAIKEFQQVIRPDTTTTLPDCETTIYNVLDCLRVFGQQQFNFFFTGFDENNGNYLTQSSRYQAEFALRKTIDQMAYDLSLLQRAYCQRRPESSTRRERDTLALADKLAYKALKPAVNAEYLGQTAVVTYFQKASFVRVIPYAPVAMIGIPHTCTGIFDQAENPKLLSNSKAVAVADNVRDFLAIPHEVGHYVFWHALHGNLRTQISSHLREGDAWRNKWLEEIFADVYGTVLAGPVLALDFQELLADNLDLAEDDGEHPVAMVRPYLLTYTLRQLQYNNTPLFSNAPDKLDELWTNFLRDKRGNPTSFQPQNEVGTSVSLYQTRTKSEKAVDKILELATLILPAQRETLWSSDSNTPDKTWYQNFKSEVLAQTMESPPVFSPGSQLFQDWQAGNSLFPWFGIYKDAVEKTRVVLTPEMWSTLLEGGGWAAGGPESSGNPPTGG